MTLEIPHHFVQPLRLLCTALQATVLVHIDTTTHSVAYRGFGLLLPGDTAQPAASRLQLFTFVDGYQSLWQLQPPEVSIGVYNLTDPWYLSGSILWRSLTNPGYVKEWEQSLTFRGISV